jgi:hypothetical protein
MLNLLFLRGDPSLSGRPFVEEAPTNLREWWTLLLPTPPRQRQWLDVQLFRRLILVHVVVEDTYGGCLTHTKSLSFTISSAEATQRCVAPASPMRDAMINKAGCFPTAISYVCSETGCSFFPLYYQAEKFLLPVGQR